MLSQQICRKILFSLLCLLGITALTGCAPKSSRFGIVFINRFADIYRIPDNTQNKVEQLTFTPTIGEYVKGISKNGDKIIFSTDFYSDSDMSPSELKIEQLRHVYLLDTTNKKLVDITNVLENKYPQIGPEFYMDWSPNQKKFVVVTYEGGGYEIKSFLEFVDFDGTNRKDVLIPTTGEIPSLINGVKWSPDGKKFILTQGVIGFKQQQENPGVALLVYDLESGNLVQITDYMDGCFPSEWSPTNKKIVAICRPNFPYMNENASFLPETIRIFDIENPGQSYERIAFTSCDNPSWSPDGKQIAFVCAKDKNYKGIFVVNSDGSGIHEIKLGGVGNPAVLYSPIWSPDGKQIIYVAGSDYEHTNIYSKHLDDSSNRSLTNQNDFYHLLSVYSLP